VPLLGIKELPSGVWVGEPSADQDLREDVADPELLFQVERGG
jgi:hypothetical protein